jgi:hypothetical protein
MVFTKHLIFNMLSLMRWWWLVDLNEKLMGCFMTFFVLF